MEVNSPVMHACEVPAAEIARTLRYPPSATRVLPLLKRLLMDGDVSIFQIADVIRLDPGIAARVLHAANSPVYRRGVRCTSVATAINMIGCDAIYEMVANAVAEQVLVIPLQAYALEADEFWLGSVASAIAAECIADECELDRNVAYTLGLLSGIGMVAIDHWIRANSPALALFKRTFPRDYCESERALLGCTNSEVATLVLRSWDFPPDMSLPVRWQYAPWEAGSFRQLSALLHCAKWVSASVCARQPGQAPAPAPRAMDPLKFNAAKLARIVSVVETRLCDVQRRLEAQPLDAA